MAFNSKLGVMVCVEVLLETVSDENEMQVKQMQEK
jgi:hypothetical protein